MVGLPADPLEVAAQNLSRPGELLLACAGREAYTTRGAVHA
jgi:hypothetical protein